MFREFLRYLNILCQNDSGVIIFQYNFGVYLCIFYTALFMNSSAIILYIILLQSSLNEQVQIQSLPHLPKTTFKHKYSY